MKAKLSLGILLFFVISSCKKNSSQTVVKKNYPFYKEFYHKGHLTYYNKAGVLFERFHYSDETHSSKVHFLDLKNDTTIINTKNLKGLSSFIKDFCLYKDNFIQLNTHPRTMGKNHKSTDFITVYDSSFNVVKEKDMEISKYPNGNALLGGNNNTLLYITDGRKFKEIPKLVISQIDDSLNILEQKIIRGSKEMTGYNPVKSIFIPDIGVVIVSASSYFEVEDINYRLELFNMDFNKLWSKEISNDSIIALDYIKWEKKIMLTTKNDVQFWDVSRGNKTSSYELDDNIINSTIGNKNAFLLVKSSKNLVVNQISFLGKLLKEKEISIKHNENNNVYLKYENNNLFLLDINNNDKSLTIDKVYFE